MNTKVLLADDSMVMRAIVADALHDIGVTDVVQTAGGDEALERFMQQDFDLVIVDWCMPGMNGLDVIRGIRATGSDVPIIMVTATGTERDEVMEAVRTGASDYLLKPFDLQVLREKLKRLCPQARPDAVRFPLEQRLAASGA
ncbi:MAG TPA: response regulator [Thermoguttaceae bacterium]|nr:response regulator [Thermoguttaceae bacterium]